MLYQKTENAFLSVLDKTENGTFTFENPDGKIYDFAGKHAGPHGHLKLRAPDVLWNMTIGGDTALAGDYRTGKWDSDDISALVDFAFRNEETMRPFSPYIDHKILKPLLKKRFSIFFSPFLF